MGDNITIMTISIATIVMATIDTILLAFIFVLLKLKKERNEIREYEETHIEVDEELSSDDEEQRWQRLYSLNKLLGSFIKPGTLSDDNIVPINMNDGPSMFIKVCKIREYKENICYRAAIAYSKGPISYMHDECNGWAIAENSNKLPDVLFLDFHIPGEYRGVDLMGVYEYDGNPRCFYKRGYRDKDEYFTVDRMAKLYGRAKMEIFCAIVKEALVRYPG